MHRLKGKGDPEHDSVPGTSVPQGSEALLTQQRHEGSTSDQEKAWPEGPAHLSPTERCQMGLQTPSAPRQQQQEWSGPRCLQQTTKMIQGLWNVNHSPRKEVCTQVQEWSNILPAWVTGPREHWDNRWRIWPDSARHTKGQESHTWAEKMVR